MRKVALVFAMLGLLGTLPVFAPYAEAKTVKNQKVAHHHDKLKKKTKRKVYKRPKHAHHVNKPKEGELLKLEGMVKDLNEQ